MKKNLCFLISLLTLTFATAFAAPTDVTPKKMWKGSQYLRVTRIGDSSKFERCFKGFDAACKPLGGQVSFTHKELEAQAFIERAQVVGAGVLDAVAAVATGGAALAVQSGLLVSLSMSSGALLVAPVGAGVIGAGVVASTVNAANPFEQHKQAKTLAKGVYKDLDMTVEDGKAMSKFIERLDMVLTKISMKNKVALLEQMEKANGFKLGVNCL